MRAHDWLGCETAATSAAVSVLASVPAGNACRAAEPRGANATKHAAIKVLIVMYRATPEGSPARCASSDEQITGLIPPPATAPIAPMETPENLTRTSNMSAKKPPCGPYISGCTTPSATTIASVISAGSRVFSRLKYGHTYTAQTIKPNR